MAHRVLGASSAARDASTGRSVGQWASLIGCRRFGMYIDSCFLCRVRRRRPRRKSGCNGVFHRRIGCFISCHGRLCLGIPKSNGPTSGGTSVFCRKVERRQAWVSGRAKGVAGRHRSTIRRGSKLVAVESSLYSHRRCLYSHAYFHLRPLCVLQTAEPHQWRDARHSRLCRRLFHLTLSCLIAL